MKLRILTALACVILMLCIAPNALASENTAEDISKATNISGSGYDSFGFLKDGNLKSYKKSASAATITLENTEGMGSIYLLFDLEYGAYSVTDGNKSITAGEYGFLHEYIDLQTAFGEAPKKVTLNFKTGSVRLSEIRVFSPGTPPQDVQIWNKPLDANTDLLLLATHGDDDQLFFAGLLPYYAGELGYRVQVAYLTDHRNLTYSRTHEMLNGLWSVGVRAYPVFGDFADFRIDSLDGTYAEYRNLGTSKEELLEFVVTQLRRFRPLAVVGHDINGEYGHGMHMVYTDLLMEATGITNDAAQYPESAEKYGTWDVPKTYLHLYEENPITLDYDTPLENFGGMTAFEVTQKLGYPCHESQQFTWFTGWINGKNTPITKATEIATYNPCLFGLFRSTVGEDVQKNDFLENLTTYAEQERLEAERLEAERLEQERLEAERLEQERLEAERLEQERLEAERLEKERLERERLQAAQLALQQREQKLRVAFGVLIVLLILLAAVLCRLATKPRR